MLWLFNIIPHVVLTPNTKLFSLLLHNYNLCHYYELRCKYMKCRISDKQPPWKGHWTLKGVSTHRLGTTAPVFTFSVLTLRHIPPYLFDMGSEGSNIGPPACNWANNSRTLPPLLTVLLCNPSWPRICYVSYNSLGFMAVLALPLECWDYRWAPSCPVRLSVCVCVFCCCYSLFFKISCIPGYPSGDYVARDSLELLILPALSPECWDYMYARTTTPGLCGVED